MANIQISDLTTITEPNSTDVIPIEQDPTGTKVTKKVAVSNLPVSTPVQTALNLKQNALSNKQLNAIKLTIARKF